MYKKLWWVGKIIDNLQMITKLAVWMKSARKKKRAKPKLILG